MKFEMGWRHWIKDRLRHVPQASASRSVPRQAPLPIHIVLYTRAGCHLCDDAKRLLLKHQSRFRLQIQEVDIDGDVRLKSRYDQCVPVVAIAGRERFRGRVNEALLVRQLKAEAKG